MQWTLFLLATGFLNPLLYAGTPTLAEAEPEAQGLGLGGEWVRGAEVPDGVYGSAPAQGTQGQSQPWSAPASLAFSGAALASCNHCSLQVRACGDRKQPLLGERCKGIVEAPLPLVSRTCLPEGSQCLLILSNPPAWVPHSLWGDWPVSWSLSCTMNLGEVGSEEFGWPCDQTTG